MSLLSEMGINVIESEESDESGEDNARSTAVAAAPTGAVAAPSTTQELERTDDPVRMYLREMGSIELLSRQGEIEIAKRIEAGRETMIGGICESPLTMQAIVGWREALKNDQVLLRDIVDLDATYGGGPAAADLKGGNAGKAKAEGAAPGAAAKGANGSGDAKGGDQRDGGDDEGANISLSAMEELLKPSVLETFGKIASQYKKLNRLQEQLVDARLNNKELTPAQQRRYEKLKRELVVLMDGVHLNNNRIEALVDQLYGLNRRLRGLEGRPAASCRGLCGQPRELPQAPCRTRARSALARAGAAPQGGGLGRVREERGAPDQGHQERDRRGVAPGLAGCRRVPAHRRYRAARRAQRGPGQEGDGRSQPAAGDLDRQEVQPTAVSSSST